MEFAVPFISVPVKDAWDLTKGSVANINTGALVLTGMFVLISTVFIPTFLKIFKFFPKTSFLEMKEQRSK